MTQAFDGTSRRATRRSLLQQFCGGLAALLAAPVLAPTLATAAARSTAGSAPATMRKSPRLRPGDTVGLIEPASASDEPFDLTLVEEAIAALGLRSKRGQHLLGRYGYLSGTDEQRAADINAMFADPTVRALVAVRGGWGCARVLPLLDWNVIRANPKLVVGYSDITALHLAIAARGGFVTLHAPNGASAWGEQSVASFRSVAFDGATPTFRNPVAAEDRLVQRKWRTQSLRGGKATGRLLGGNLTVLTALVGTPYLPSFDGAILFLEDINEAEYRIDRMLTQLGQAGVLRKLAGLVFGQCNKCTDPEPGSYGGFPLSALLEQHIKPLRIPAYHGAYFGHMEDQFTIPVGVRAEIDADAHTLTLLEPAVV